MNTQLLTESAQLAQAAYADLRAGMDAEAARNALELVGFATTQAQQFLDRYEVVTRYADDASFLEGNGTSLSVTVFRHRTSGQLTLAIRGTQEGGDYATGSFGIIGGGAAYPQIAALYNGWLRVTAAPGSTVPQYRVIRDNANHPDALAVPGGYLVRSDSASAATDYQGRVPADPPLVHAHVAGAT